MPPHKELAVAVSGHAPQIGLCPTRISITRDGFQHAVSNPQDSQGHTLRPPLGTFRGTHQSTPPFPSYATNVT